MYLDCGGDCRRCVLEAEGDLRPEPDTRWRHRNGVVYRVLFIANLPDHEGYPETVVYEGELNGRRWAARLDDWHRRMTRVRP